MGGADWEGVTFPTCWDRGGGGGTSRGDTGEDFFPPLEEGFHESQGIGKSFLLPVFVAEWWRKKNRIDQPTVPFLVAVGQHVDQNGERGQVDSRSFQTTFDSLLALPL